MEFSSFMNESQTVLVQQSWPKLVSKSFWSSFYLNLFERSPSYQLFFNRFARVPREELQFNVHFLAHASRTGFAFNAAIDLLGNSLEFRRILEDLGAKHRQFHLTAEHFQIVKDVLMDCIENRLKNESNNTERTLTESWKLCISLVIGVIKDSAIGDIHSDASMTRKPN
ncbi:uncharacterized protein LOC112684877 [Sipha flava]|uniref:Uncharacterized protein LOC112684877 n=1 Tax=Sipha flava TaxID=143950 RepID=A0A8B8FN66_9HEMI|nr:uncharacterized protein LOC112684877 [Sipha flava]XP_025412379.1 uncharacterized protein LOC112684877 [Sipha flava]